MALLWSEESHFNKPGGKALKLAFLLVGLQPYVSLVGMDIQDISTSALVMWLSDLTYARGNLWGIWLENKSKTTIFSLLLSYPPVRNASVI